MSTEPIEMEMSIEPAMFGEAINRNDPIYDAAVADISSGEESDSGMFAEYPVSSSEGSDSDSGKKTTKKTTRKNPYNRFNRTLKKAYNTGVAGPLNAIKRTSKAASKAAARLRRSPKYAEAKSDLDYADLFPEEKTFRARVSRGQTALADSTIVKLLGLHAIKGMLDVTGDPSRYIPVTNFLQLDFDKNVYVIRVRDLIIPVFAYRVKSVMPTPGVTFGMSEVEDLAFVPYKLIDDKLYVEPTNARTLLNLDKMREGLNIAEIVDHFESVEVHGFEHGIPVTNLEAIWNEETANGLARSSILAIIRQIAQEELTRLGLPRLTPEDDVQLFMYNLDANTATNLIAVAQHSSHRSSTISELLSGYVFASNVNNNKAYLDRTIPYMGLPPSKEAIADNLKRGFLTQKIEGERKDKRSVEIAKKRTETDEQRAIREARLASYQPKAGGTRSYKKNKKSKRHRKTKKRKNRKSKR